MTQRVGEAIVLRTWPFQEADVLVSLFTREQGKVKGVARHAMRSRRRFGGALEPMTHVRATYLEKPRQDLVRLDAFEVISSPLGKPVDYTRLAALELVAEILDQAMPDGASDDPVFRLTVSVLEELQVGAVWMPVSYFALWMSRLMGWMPELGRCILCGRALRSETVWWSSAADGVTCEDDRRGGSLAVSADSVEIARRIFRDTVQALATEEWPKSRAADLRRFAIDLLERHLQERLVSARALR